MSLATVSELRSALGVGSLYPDATLQQVCDASDAVLLPMLWANKYYAIGHANTGTVGTLYFQEDVRKVFYIGQTVTVSNGGAHYNGSHVITAVGDYSISYTTDHLTDSPYHPYAPYATVAASEYTDWTADAAVQEAALMIAVDIWQARQTPATGGSGVDFQPGPYKMGRSVMSRISGLLAPYIGPRSMVG